MPSTVLNHDINGDAIRALGNDPADVLPLEGGDGTVLASGDRSSEPRRPSRAIACEV